MGELIVLDDHRKQREEALEEEITGLLALLEKWVNYLDWEEEDPQGHILPLSVHLQEDLW